MSLIGLMRRGLVVAGCMGMAACAGPSATVSEDVSAQLSGTQSLADECRKKLGALREDVLRETCKVIETHIVAMDARLQDLCRDAGEKIYRTVDDVDGVYIHIPDKDPNSVFRFYHEDDRLPHSYMAPILGRHYTFWEMDSFRIEGMVEHHTLNITVQGKGRAKWGQTHAQIPHPEAVYGIRWKYLTSSEDQRKGLYGEKLTIFDVKTQETLATRKVFFYVVRDGIIDASGQTAIYMRVPMVSLYRFVSCPNYSPGKDDSYTDQRPHHSYGFVSKVLRPRIMSDEIAPHVFDLARGTGRKRLNVHLSGCHTLGPRITPDDVLLTKVNEWDLQITIKGTEDSLLCTSFFHPTRFSHEADKVFSTLRFYDGTKWKAEDIVRRVKGP